MEKGINWGDHIRYEGQEYRVAEVDLGKKNFSLSRKDGTNIWVSREDLLDSMLDIEIKQNKEAVLA